MKTIKNIVFILTFFCIIPFLGACGKEAQIVLTTLNTPTEIVVVDNQISWTAVENADYYQVGINGVSEDYRTNETNICIDKLSQSGKYEIFVVAYSNLALYVHSQKSEIYKYDNRQQAQTPTNFEIDETRQRLSWTKVATAQNYILLINDSPIVLTNRNYVTSGSKILVDLNNYKEYIFAGRENTFCVYTAETSSLKVSEKSEVLTLVKVDDQETPTNVKVTKVGKQAILTFDGVSTAESGYTYFVNNEAGVIINETRVDISSQLSYFGNYQISVCANEVFTQDGKTKYNESQKQTISFENKPSFVGLDIQDISVSKKFVSFGLFDEASEYKISISKMIYTDAELLSQFTISQQELTDNNNKVDISQHTEQVGKYIIEVYALQSGREGQNYQSNKTENRDLKVSKILDIPVLTIQNDGTDITITVESIEYASSVLVYMNDNNAPVLTLQNIVNATASGKISKALLNSGDNQFYCKAVGDKDLFLDSQFSDYQTYKIAQINVPTNLKVSSNRVLTFSYSGDYERFLVYVNDNQIGDTTDLQYELDITRAGIYSIYVSAVYQGNEGSASNKLTYLITEKLSAPTNLKVSNKVLTFDAVPNAVCYDVFITNAKYNDYLLFAETNKARLELPDNIVCLGDNQIKVLAYGDGQIYLTSDLSATYTFKVTNAINEVTGITGEVKNEKYYLKFDGVSLASGYIIDLTTPSQKTYSIESEQTLIDIDRYMTELGEYTFEITAISNNPDYTNSKTTAIINFDVLYNKLYYQSTNFFYDGHQYSMIFSDVYSLQDFVLYAVLYGIEEANVYIDNSNSEFDLQNNSLKSYLPCLSNFGVDFSNGNNLASAFMPLLLTMNTQKFADAMRLFERAHDQLYLYFDIDDAMTKQSDASKNANVYTIKINYEDGFTINPTNNHGKQLVEKYDVVERDDFAIDNLTKTAPVETVAQLLMVVQSGRKPEFTKENTIAELTYEYAKNVLSKICNNSMSDADKAIAIHDWIVFNNDYANDTYDSASGEPFSVENLNDMSFFASGTLLYHYSVCSGYAQTFSLLCNIEGIEAIATFGLCGSNLDFTRISFKTNAEILSTLIYLVQNYGELETIGAHSWNRVKVDIGNGKKWYVVDPTWDDTDTETDISQVNHTYMFVNDEFIADERKELFPVGDLYHRTDENGEIIYYNATDDRDYYDYINS